MSIVTTTNNFHSMHSRENTNELPVPTIIKCISTNFWFCP